MVDYSFYTTVWGGTLPEPLFLASLPQAEEMILAVLHPRTVGDLEEDTLREIQKAVCAQTESGLDKPYDTADNGVFKADYAPSLVRVFGHPLAPAALSILRRAGLLDTWL